MSKTDTLLQHMRSRHGAVVTYEELARILWPEAQPRTWDVALRVFMNRARRRLHPWEAIDTVWGQGWRYLAQPRT